jgi:hypothetical protein
MQIRFDNLRWACVTVSLWRSNHLPYPAHPESFYFYTYLDSVSVQYGSCVWSQLLTNFREEKLKFGTDQDWSEQQALSRRTREENRPIPTKTRAKEVDVPGILRGA